MSLLALRDLALGLGGKPVLDGVSLRVEEGEFVSILGPSGAGKSTLFRLMGGMRQRAALLRTVAQDRRMLLLDEPFGALDALTRIEMQRWLEARWAAERWTTLLVTHDVREAVRLSDHIYVLTPRPARVAAEFAVPFGRPRLGGPVPAAAHALEDAILDTLINPQGDADAPARPRRPDRRAAARG